MSELYERMSVIDRFGKLLAKELACIVVVRGRLKKNTLPTILGRVYSVPKNYGEFSQLFLAFLRRPTKFRKPRPIPIMAHVSGSGVGDMVNTPPYLPPSVPVPSPVTMA